VSGTWYAHLSGDVVAISAAATGFIRAKLKHKNTLALHLAKDFSGQRLTMVCPR
jgi:hypothetical protein